MSQEAALADVVIVDYGLGNLRSVTRGLERVGADVAISEDPATFADADGVVLPGVGAFSEGMENAGPFREALLDVADRGQPLFGICLGMQMLLTTSEEAAHAGEGDVEGLDLIPGTNVRFTGDRKVPHMGWNELRVEREHPIVSGAEPLDAVAGDVAGDGTGERGSADGTDERAPASGADGRGIRTTGGSVDGEHAYFVHSYYAVPDDDAAVVATTDYGERFPAVVADEAGNVFGTQFHPEKSGETGLTILRHFVDYCREWRRR